MEEKLVTAYKKFQTADINFRVDMHIEKLASPELEKLAKDVVTAMKGNTVDELKDFANVLLEIADEYARSTVINYDAKSDYAKTIDVLLKLINDEVKKELAKRGDVRANSTGNRSNGASDSAPSNPSRPFLQRFFG